MVKKLELELNNSKEKEVNWEWQVKLGMSQEINWVSEANVELLVLLQRKFLSGKPLYSKSIVPSGSTMKIEAFTSNNKMRHCSEKLDSTLQNTVHNIHGKSPSHRLEVCTLAE